MDGVKYDSGKPRWDLVPWAEMQDVVQVLTFGAHKYGANNWKHVPEAQERYFAAALRHLVAWKSGEVLDPESGLPHLAHAVSSLLFLSNFDERNHGLFNSHNED
jgi:hypothetical protein